ncbi:MAG: CpsB/CapC family capsule biosynthesis tyrosine phosphatase, partial [Candidatus Acidiferrum sp.]
GCFIQVTAGSLAGVFGPGAQKDSWRWLGDGLVHIVASDAHNTRGRPLKLRPAFDLVNEQFGEEKARALFVENPMAAFEGRNLPHVPSLPDSIGLPRRKRFFFF